MDADPPTIATFETAHYGVRLIVRDPERLVVVFASSGARRIDGISEEFRGSFEPTGVSLLFVTDRDRLWYNHDESEQVFERVAVIARRFAHVGAIGESMGGCGAILFSNFLPGLDRVLAFSPQYSIFPPYILFDPVADHSRDVLPNAMYEDFSRSPIRDRVVLIYGNTNWRDHIHAGMYQAAGFTRLLVDAAPHEVASHLKSSDGTNRLAELAALFADFATPFTPDTLRARLPLAWTETALRPEGRVAAEHAAMAAFNRDRARPVPIPPAAAALLSEGCPASQSSTSEWSRDRDPRRDAAGLVNGRITGLHQMHTAGEERPWWALDLGAVRRVHEIRVFNRIDHYHAARRAFDLRLEVSELGEDWRIVLDKHDGVSFGGLDGRPLVQRCEPPDRFRYLRLSLNHPGQLCLDQVQVYGDHP